MLPLLRKNILATIAYYTALDYPVTTFECWRYLLNFSPSPQQASFFEITKELAFLAKEKRVCQQNGFWRLNLSQQERLGNQRVNNQKISIAKLKRVQRWARILEFLPYLKAIIVTGTLGMKRAGKNSDWDVLLVLKKKRIWIGRLVISMFLGIFHKRRTDKKIKDRFCLNHFLTEDGLILEEQNEFSAKEIALAIPVLGKLGKQKFLQLNEFWMSKFLPNYQKDRQANLFFRSKNHFAHRVSHGLEKLLGIFSCDKRLNQYLKKKMVKRIKANPKTYQQTADIRFNDQALIFLPDPQRKKILHKMQLS